MAKGSRLLLVAVLCLGLLPFMVQSAFACSCGRTTDGAMAQEADAVFAGYVTRGEYPEGVETVDDTLGEVRWTFLPDTIVKGVDDGPVDVTSESQGSACGVGFKLGQRYLVFAHENKGTLSTDSCSRTRGYYDEVKLAGAEKVEGVHGEASGSAEGSSWLGFKKDDGSWSVSYLVGTFAVLAVLLLLGAMLFRRSRASSRS